MAHEIDFTNNATGAAFFAGRPAWHGHGTVVQDAQTSADALRLASLDWTVDLCPIQAVTPTATLDAPTHRAIYRTDTGAVLGVVGTDYVPLQNREAFQWLDDVCGGDNPLAMWETAGSLKGGRQIWCLAKLPAEVEVTRQDILQQYVLITTSHDGSQAIRLFPTSVRVVCANTLRFATSTARGGLRLRHTRGSLADRVRKAREALGVIASDHETFTEQARTLAGRPVDDQTLGEYFETVIGMTSAKTDKGQARILDELHNRFFNDKNEGQYGANLWTAYNAVSEWADHGGRSKSPESRFNSNLFGSAHQYKVRAWSEALTLAT